MELLERYLHSVGFWLPKAQRQDILQELSGDIQSQIEDAERERGGPLADRDIEAILRRYGHPIVVAGRFLPQRCLIGPTLFQPYVFVLRRIAVFYLVPWILVWLFLAIFVPAYRAEHPGLHLLSTLQSLWLIVVHLFTFVTIAFAVAERSATWSALFARSRPRQVPPPRDRNRLSRAGAITTIIWLLVFVLWWTESASLPAPGSVRMAPELRNFYWPVLLLSLGGIGLAVVDFVRPSWTRPRAAMYVVLDGACLILFCALLVSGPWIDLSMTNVPADRAAAALRWINLPVLVTLVVCAVASLLRTIQDVRRLLGRPPVRNRALAFFIDGQR